MLVRIFSYLIICTISVAIYGLFTIKDKVTNLYYQVKVIDKQLDNENNMIHILKAEQSYLSSPIRLKKLATLYLQLDNIKIKQMTSDPLAPEKKHYVQYNMVNDGYSVKTKWRYKRIINDKYIKTISNRKIDE